MPTLRSSTPNPASLCKRCTCLKWRVYTNPQFLDTITKRAEIIDVSIKKQLHPVFTCQHQVCCPPRSPLCCFFCGFALSQVFSIGWQLWAYRHSREGGSGQVEGLSFIGSPLTCEQGNGMFRKLAYSGVNDSFILKKKNPVLWLTPSPGFIASHGPCFVRWSNRAWDLLYFQAL